ncbi:MAG: exonuclease SbcCD subunit D [Lachnospiraceae bacterium]|nr:exonuclease SbcCD subunit D [Lachnospiraceae bacterium]
MRFFHISDLHIGKQLHFYNLKENQRAILKQITKQTERYCPDALLIAGDVFDKSVPSGEAYTVFDEFLNDLAALSHPVSVCMIAGNHDSAERLRYASSFLEKNRIYISSFPPGNREEHLKKVVFEDSFGPVFVYLLPFTKPAYVRQLFPEGTIISYQKAIEEILRREEIDFTKRNVLVSHQFYISGDQYPATCESEQAFISVGGIDSVDVSCIKSFDYGALGHLHGPQWIGEPKIRYCGSPLKYSVSEASQEKSITMVTLEEKGKEAKIETIPLFPNQNVRKERGTLEAVLEQANKLTKAEQEDFISITLTDDKELFRPREQLEEYYPYLLEVKMDNSRTKAEFTGQWQGAHVLEPMEAFRNFYREMQGVSMNREEEELILEIIQKAKEGEA